MTEKIELYEPSNGTEGESFENEFCNKCMYSNCPIHNDARLLIVCDDRFPNQWRYKNDKPICTSFVRKI